MGVDYSVYIGPFVRCENPDVTNTESYTACATASCPKHDKQTSNKFCPECGKAISTLVRTVSAPKVDAWDVSEQLNESFFTPGTNYGRFPFELNIDIWVPNRRLPGIAERTEEPLRGGYDEVDEDEVEAEKTALVGACGQDLAKFREIYGNNEVSVHWGVLHYAW